MAKVTKGKDIMAILGQPGPAKPATPKVATKAAAAVKPGVKSALKKRKQASHIPMKAWKKCFEKTKHMCLEKTKCN